MIGCLDPISSKWGVFHAIWLIFLNVYKHILDLRCRCVFFLRLYIPHHPFGFATCGWSKNEGWCRGLSHGSRVEARLGWPTPLGCPPQDSSHQQDYILFLVGNPYKPSFSTESLGGGTTQPTRPKFNSSPLEESSQINQHFSRARLVYGCFKLKGLLACGHSIRVTIRISVQLNFNRWTSAIIFLTDFPRDGGTTWDVLLSRICFGILLRAGEVPQFHQRFWMLILWQRKLQIVIEKHCQKLSKN